jgi:hypothetical protein
MAIDDSPYTPGNEGGWELTKHTPGMITSLEAFDILGADQKLVATVYSTSRSIYSNKAKANARLIKGALPLLKACQQLIAAYESAGGNGDPEITTAYLQAVKAVKIVVDMDAQEAMQALRDEGLVDAELDFDAETRRASNASPELKNSLLNLQYALRDLRPLAEKGDERAQIALARVIRIWNRYAERYPDDFNKIGQ